MHADLWAVPAGGFLALAAIMLEAGSTPMNAIETAAPLTAIGGAVYITTIFLKRQDKREEEAASERKQANEAHERSVAAIVQAHRETAAQTIESLRAIDGKVGDVREDVAKLVDRNTAKDAA